MNDFASGVRSMARNCLPAVDLVRRGTWTLDDVEKWLQAIIENDKGYLDKLLKSPVEVEVTATGYNFSAKLTVLPPETT